MTSLIYPEWQTGDILLDKPLRRRYADGFPVSPYGLIIFRQLDWLVEASHVKDDVVYGHVSQQQGIYIGKDVKMLCGEKMSLYSVSNIFSFVNIEQVNDKLICIECAVKAEKIYWIRYTP